jgi:hypothetical protein
LFLLILSIIIIVLYSIVFFRNPFLGVDRNIYVLIFSGLFILYYLFGIIRNYHYFFFTDNGSKLVFRYYSLRPMSKRQNAIEISKTTFVDYKITMQLFGFRKYLVLSQKMPNGSVAKYLPVNITMLNKENLNQLTIALQSYRNKQNN